MIRNVAIIVLSILAGCNSNERVLTKVDKGETKIHRAVITDRYLFNSSGYGKTVDKFQIDGMTCYLVNNSYGGGMWCHVGAF